MDSGTRTVLVAGGIGSAGIALLQPIIYIGGPDLYRTLGAPPYIADLRALEPLRMLLWSTFWFGLFATFALYAFSGARLIPRLPLLRTGLLTISVICFLRGLAVIPQLILFDQLEITRGQDVAFSTLAILLALSYAIGARNCNKHPENREGC